MAKMLGGMLYLVLLLVNGDVFRSSVAQTIHIVGNSTGWRIPSGGAATYTAWASQQTFAAGDILVFNFTGGTHDVTEVTKAEFDACTASDPITSVTTAPANVSLSSVGEHYFICSFSGHCNAGQKLSVTVSNTSDAAPTANTTSSPIPPTTTTSSSLPQPSSAPLLSAITIPFVLFSFLVGVFFH